MTGLGAPYKKPPIVEAVLALHFAQSLPFKDMEAFTRRVKKEYPAVEEMISVDTTITFPSKRSEANVNRTGFKISSADRARLVIMQPNQFGIIQQAPYSGWEDLFKETVRCWDLMQKVISLKPVTRVSTRFVNRIDIPIPQDGKIELSNYFNIGLSLPKYAQSMALQQFYMSCTLNHENEKLMNVIQFVAIDPVIIDHLSFAVDIDVATLCEIPRHDDKMWQLVNELRQYKNELFEACITPATRQLFQ